MTVPRFYLDLPEHPLETAVLEGEEHHHASRVLRMRVGEEAVLLNGRGAAFRAEVISIDGRRTVLRVKESLPPEEEESPRLSLLQCLPSGQKMDEVVRRTVELGIHAIYPVVSARSRGAPGPERLSRWRKIAREASRVAGRARLPVIGDTLDWKEALALMAAAGDRTLALYADEEGGERPSALLGSVELEEVLMLVGPEGGLTAAERESLREAGVPSVTLGKYVLRTESAAAVMLAVLRTHLGHI